MRGIEICTRSSDLESVVTVLRAVHDQGGCPTVWPEYPSSWLTPSGTLGASVAISAGLVVGHALLVPGETIEHVAHVLRAAGVPLSRIGGVSRLFVSPSTRGAGAAAKLVEHVEAEAPALGLRLALDVTDDGGPAIRLYEGRGWIRVATGPAGWVRPDGTRPRSAAYLCPAVPASV